MKVVATIKLVVVEFDCSLSVFSLFFFFFFAANKWNFIKIRSLVRVCFWRILLLQDS